MPTLAQDERDEQAFMELAQAKYRAMREWRAQHPEASLDDIARQAVVVRQQLMALAVQQLAGQHGDGTVPEGLACERCGAPLVYKGRLRRKAIHLEMEIELERAYYYCPHCAQGVFPP